MTHPDYLKLTLAIYVLRAQRGDDPRPTREQIAAEVKRLREAGLLD